MIGPTWLAAIFGVIMIAAAVYALVRIVVARRTRRPTDYDVDVHHVLMGVSMGGMLVPGLRIVEPGASTTTWTIVWILVTLWFAVTVVRDSQEPGPRRRFAGHHVPHLVMSAAMIYMLAAPLGMTQASGAKGMSGMGGSGGLVPWPTLDALFLVFMAGYAVVVLDRFPTLVDGLASRSILLAPRGARVEDVVMAVTMGYMLTMMLV